MRLLVSEELLRQTFGLEAPILAIKATGEMDAHDGPIFEFTVGAAEGPQALLYGRGHSHEHDGERWYRMEYEVVRD